MTTDPVRAALLALSGALAKSPALARTLYARWRAGRGEVPDAIEPAAEAADEALPAWTRGCAPADVRKAFRDATGEVIFIWCAASVSRRDARLAPVLSVAVAHPEYRDQALAVVRQRIVEGPLEDALACLPLLGTGDALERSENAEARARMEILLWEAGAAALDLPTLGRWIWASDATFEALVGRPARGSLRGRVLAARCLEVAVSGMPPTTDPALVGRTLQTLQPLLLHPEPMVWIHAARAFGRLVGAFEPLEGTLLDWVHHPSQILRQRAITGFASLPAQRLSFLGGELVSIVEAAEEEGWVLAAAAAATPYLFHERRDVWDRLAGRILAGSGGAVAARALARGLASLWRRGRDREAIEGPMRRLREMARRARSPSVDDWRRWLEVIALTDPIDGAERDPLDVEIGLENLVRVAAQYDDEEADARAARFASTLSATFLEARRLVLGDGSLRQRSAALNAFEGCARALALRLWGPMLATRPHAERIAEDPDLEPTWEIVARAPAEILDVVAERRESEVRDPDFELALEVLALKLGGYALDACGEEPDLGPGRGPTAHETCLWLRKLDGLADESRELPAPLRGALSALFWRLVDTTRGTALGEVDDVEWLGPFAAWWALVIDRPALLQQLATALPMIAEGALETCCELADTTRAALSSGAANGTWGPAVQQALGALRAEGTELAAALAGLSLSLQRFATAAGARPELEASCADLVQAAERLQAALVDPVKALHRTEGSVRPPAAGSNVPRMATVMARAIRTRQLSMIDVWLATLGPTTAALVESAVSAAIGRTPPPPPTPKKREPKIIEGYELLSPLGEGGVGTVWLVRKPGADRYFVLKIPKADALANASDTEREGILASFVDEARALAGLYHPNVANIIDRGVAGNVPFLVLEYLIGADLKQYSSAKLMSLSELRQLVPETCAGLTALHNAGLVHRDIKPANIWLRLPLAGGVRFDPAQHRDPSKTHPLSSVIIDFGMVRAQRVAQDVSGRFVAGTPGYIPPEQVLDPPELDGRADVYALAGSIYNVTTGRTFFDEIDQPRERIMAHLRRDPMEDPERFRAYPAALVKLLRAATAREWRDRPTPLELGREFVACIG
jgi:serine/threonine-protein kinase